MDGKQCKTILYGNSLILEGVRAELSGEPDIEVLMLDEPLEQRLEEMRLLKPTAIIYDLAAVQPSFPLTMLQQPGLLLIGIDSETHQALVWSGRQRRAVVAADLIRIIHQQVV